MFKRSFATAGAAALLAALLTGPARAEVDIQVDKSTQRMTVSVDGVPRHVWRVSTGRAGFGTPNGRFRPQRLARTWFSRKYYNSPMPHSIFFHGGFAIHGSNEISRLGGPASHGCVRLHPANAATLYALVQAEGAGNTRITVSGSSGIATAERSSAGRRLSRDWDDEAGTFAGREALRAAPRRRSVVIYYPAYRAVYAPRYYVPRYAPGYDWDD